MGSELEIDSKALYDGDYKLSLLISIGSFLGIED